MNPEANHSLGDLLEEEALAAVEELSVAQRAQVADCDAAPRSLEYVTQTAERSDEVSSIAWDQEQNSERRDSGAAAGTCGSVALHHGQDQ